VKVGDLVQWYTEYADATTVDYGIVLHNCPQTNVGVWIHWFSGYGSGWFDTHHPSIGVVSEGR